MRKLVDARLGEDNIFFASDYPHERRRAEFMKDPPEFIERQDLSDQIKETILFRNTQRFYRLD